MQFSLSANRYFINSFFGAGAVAWAWAALAAKPHPGPTPRLDARQKARLVKLLLAGPLAAGYTTNLWTCRRVKELIVRHFGVSGRTETVQLAWANLPAKEVWLSDTSEQP